MLDAYTIKKVLPRLIVAVLLVNLSWYICISLMETTNVVGNGIKGLLWAPFSNVPHGTSISGQLVLLLWGAGSLGAVPAGLWLVFGGGWAVLLSALFSVLAALMLVFVILILREIVLIFLVLISPLALVLWVLPGTEQWAKRWWGLFTKLLLMFPVFMGLLAVGEIMSSVHNAQHGGTSAGLIHNVVGLVMYVIPFFMLPFLFKAMGGFLGQITGMINDKEKGLLDRSKNWSKGMRDRSGLKQYQEGRKSDKMARNKHRYTTYRDGVDFDDDGKKRGFVGRSKTRLQYARSHADPRNRWADNKAAEEADAAVRTAQAGQYERRGQAAQEQTLKLQRSAAILDAQKMAAAAAAAAVSGGSSTKDAQNIGLQKVVDEMSRIADSIENAVANGDANTADNLQGQFNAMASYLASQKADGQLSLMQQDAATTGGALGVAWAGAIRDSETYGSLKEFSPHLVAEMTPGGGIKQNWAFDIDNDLGSAAKLSKEGWKRYVAIRGDAAADALEAQVKANDTAATVYKGARH